MLPPPHFHPHISALMSTVMESEQEKTELREARRVAEVDKAAAVRQMEQVNIDADAKLAQIRDFKNMLKLALTEKGELKSALKEMKSARDLLISKVADLESKIATLEKSLAGKDGEIEELKQKVARLRTKKTDVHELQMELSQRTMEKEACIAKVLDMHHQISKTRIKWKNADEERGKLQTRVLELEKRTQPGFVEKCFPGWSSAHNLYHVPA